MEGVEKIAEALRRAELVSPETFWTRLGYSFPEVFMCAAAAKHGAKERLDLDLPEEMFMAIMQVGAALALHSEKQINAALELAGGLEGEDDT